MTKIRAILLPMISLINLILIIAVFQLYKEFESLESKIANQHSIVKETIIERAINGNDSSKSTSNANSESNGFRTVSKRGTQSVVYIETEIDAKKNLPNDKNHQFDEKFWDRFGGRPRSVSLGSGVIITADGYVLTNNHVIEGAIENKVTVVLNDNRSYDAQIIGADPATDLAVVKMNSSDFNAFVIGNSEEVEIGDWVLAIGNPFRLRSTVTAGIVSALSRDVAIIEDRMRIESFIQTDAAINKGNSGGALVNQNGELIGINTAIATETGSYEGYGFAIPSNMAIKIAKDLIEFGTVQRAYLGVQIASVTVERAKELGLRSVTGVEIVNALENGAAANAGLKKGDVVLAIDNKTVMAYNELQAKIAEYRPGDEIAVSVWSEKEKKLVTVNVILQGTETESVKNWLGLANQSVDSVKEIDNQIEEKRKSDEPSLTLENKNALSLDNYSNELSLRVEQHLDSSKLFIDFLSAESIFAKSGLQIGDQILEINQKPIRSVVDFKIHFQHYQSKGKAIIVKIKRSYNKTAYFNLIY